MENGLRAGTAKVDITPPLTVPYLGYVPRQAYFEGVHDRLHARALYVEATGERVAIVALDALGLSRGLPGGDLRINVLQRLPRELGLTPDSLMFCASHCHSGPEIAGLTSLNHIASAREWLAKLADDLAACVVEAAGAAEPAEIRLGKGEVDDISANRRVLDKKGVLHRPPERILPDEMARPALIDPEVLVMRIDFSGGRHSALFSFTCHPTTVQVNPLVSADYPGVAAALVESESPGCRHALFLQGACGDINPIGGSQVPDFDAVRRNGEKLGREAVRVLDSLQAAKPARSGPLRFVTREVDLPRRELPGASPLREHLFDLLAEAGVAAAAPSGSSASGRTARQALTEARVLVERLAEVARGPDPVRTIIQAIRIGDAAIAGIPGEPFVRHGFTVKRGSPAPFTICAGYANDYAGYLSDAESFQEGGYETSLGPWCPVGPEGGPLAVRTALELLAGIW